MKSEHDEQMKIAMQIIEQERELLAKLDDRVPHRKILGKIKKPYAIECRWAGEKQWSWQDGKWRIWKRYRTEKARDEALRTLQQKRVHWNGVNLRPWEYRAAETQSTS